MLMDLLYSHFEKQNIIIKPGDYYVIQTVEKINLPSDICAHVYMRSTLHRSGISLLSNQINPGYKGAMTFGLTNLGPASVEFELGARICHIQFTEVKGGGNAYRGQWQGGRVTTVKREKQV